MLGPLFWQNPTLGLHLAYKAHWERNKNELIVSMLTSYIFLRESNLKLYLPFKVSED